MSNDLDTNPLSPENAEAPSPAFRNKIKQFVSDSLFILLAEQLSAGVIILDELTKIVYVNATLEELTGFRADEAMGKSIAAFLNAAEISIVGREMESRRKGVASAYNISMVNESGESTLLHISATPIMDQDETYLGSLALVRDSRSSITPEDLELVRTMQSRVDVLQNELKRARNELAQVKHVQEVMTGECNRELDILRMFFENSPQGSLLISDEERLIYVNRMVEELTGVRALDMEHFKEFAAVVFPDPAYRKSVMGHWKRDRKHGFGERELRVQRADGEERYMLFRTTYLVNGASIVTFTDITEERSNRELIHHLAMHDMLTGLPNRQLFLDRLERAITAARRKGGHVACLFIDVDDFKYVNDTFGHRGGDEVLQVLGTRFQSCLREMDTVARIGGDEFALVLPYFRHPEEVHSVVERLLGVVSTPIDLEESTSWMPTISIGIATYPNDSKNRDELLTFADRAMYEAKRAGKNTYAVFSDIENAGNIEADG